MVDGVLVFDLVRGTGGHCLSSFEIFPPPPGRIPGVAPIPERGDFAGDASSNREQQPHYFFPSISTSTRCCTFCLMSPISSCVLSSRLSRTDTRVETSATVPRADQPAVKKPISAATMNLP